MQKGGKGTIIKIPSFWAAIFSVLISTAIIGIASAAVNARDQVQDHERRITSTESDLKDIRTKMNTADRKQDIIICLLKGSRGCE